MQRNEPAMRSLTTSLRQPTRTGIKGRWVALAFAAVSLCHSAVATETENTDFRILSAPGKVVVDGNLDDWNLSGSLFICSDVENYRDQFASWQSAMYDSENLYLLTRWVDTTPMNNPGLCGSDSGWGGDCLQVRLIVNASGMPDTTARQDPAVQKTTHLTAWCGRDGRDMINVTYGKRFDEGVIKDAKKEGAAQAFVKNPDDPAAGSGQGKGYIQEMAIPWKLLTTNGYVPKPGDTIVMTYEPNFGTSSKMRISTKDLFRPGVTPDRVFAFRSYDRWGLAKLEPAGKMEPLPLRLSDGRTFPVKLEKGLTNSPQDGLPVVDWKGLFKADTLEGFAKIGLQLPEDGVVSLIIKNADGQVVRNLVNAKFMTKGSQEVLWDGLSTPSDRKPGDPVPAGDYTWEAIWHKGLGLSLVGWACNGGKAPFDSPGGNWGGDMGNPSAVDADSASLYLGWGASEAGKALVCTDFDGKVKWRHKRGGFGGAALVAVDKGIVFVYDQGQGNMLYRLDSKKGEYVNWQGSDEATLELGKILASVRPAGVTNEPTASGLAALEGKLFVSYGPANTSWNREQKSGNTILVLDGATGKLLKSLTVENPGDLKVGSDGKIYVVCGTTTIATLNPETGVLTTVVDGLKDARSVTADKVGNIYVGRSDPANQIDVFDATGSSTGQAKAKLVRTIGKPGGRNLLGPWDKSGLLFVAGLKVDPKGKLWVMERDGAPRRISVWDAQTGTFEKEFVGPTDYGAGGGSICPADPYTMIGEGCEWKIAQETGKAECVAVIYRGRWQNARFGTGKGGRIYAAIGGGWHGFHPVSIYERIGPADWKLRTRLLPMAQEEKYYDGETVKENRLGGMIVWADANGDGLEQPAERKEYPMDLGGWVDGWYMYFNQAMTFSGGKYQIDVTDWTPCGAPVYAPDKALLLPVPENLATRGGMGAQKSLVSEDGNYVIFNGRYGAEHSDFPCYDIRTGKRVFSYPNNYVGVHGGHLAPPAKLGLIRAAYDFAGTVTMPPPLGNLFVIGTDKGEWHILSSSGYYISSLFEGDPMKIKWPEEAVPGANMNTVPPGMGAEDFGGSITRANDGTLYIQAGKTAFINCRVSGLDTVKPLGSGALTISPDDTQKAQQFKVKYLTEVDSAKSITVKRRTVTFTGDPSKDFDAKSVVFGRENARVNALLAHDDDTLYLACWVADATPWLNGATSFENLYACGDTVDFQLGVDPAADKKRKEATKGDLRLSFGQLGGKNVAVLYRKVSDEKAPRIFYSGVWKSGYTMEFVRLLEGVRIQTKISVGKAYVIEAAIPLKELGVSLKPGLKLRGDFGVTFGDPEGKDTNLRVYWSNQATGIVADEVEELKMQPALWGELVFE